jgi:ABC-type lipoprotein export system ATPase subunit
MRSPLISLKYVSKSHNDDPLDFNTVILRNVVLTVHDGEFLIIFGPSGSGKSTLLNLLAGLERPSAGEIRVRNRDLTAYTSEQLAHYHRMNMGMVFQNFNLIKALNVWENVALPQTANGVAYHKRRERAEHLLKLFHLEQHTHHRPGSLSGGEQQRVAIARALVNSPTFLLVDEPTGNLDSKSADEVMQILYELNRCSGHTLVLVTHNPNYLNFASRIIYLQDGSIVKEVLNTQQPAITQTILPTSNHAALSLYKRDEPQLPQAASAGAV